MLIRVVTGAMLLLPLIFVALAARGGETTHIQIAVAIGLALLYAVIFLAARPRGFATSKGRVDVVFPLWTRCIDGVLKAERLDRAELKRRYGLMGRVGVGGLWGGFGWLASRKGWLEFYISRRSGYVLITRAAGLPLLISPEQPEQFCEQVL